MDKPPLILYNSLTRKKEEFLPLVDQQVKMYTCGPTIYHYVHIGNLRTFVFEDLLRRTLKYFGYQVIQVMNLTDVDDKTIKGALAAKVPLNTFTSTYKDAFFEDIKTLKIEPVEHYPMATDYIPQMIEMIEILLKKGMAYTGGDGSVYFPIQKFANYGCLSHLKMEDLKAGASERVSSDEYEKENVSDFVLWKALDPARDGDIYWESPFGKGRPGWHMECSAMANTLLGQTIDIHMGGIDNLFPHHENEIAQSEACNEKTFAKLWMHAEHLIVEGKKMSKSLGNFYTLRDVLAKGYTGTQMRYMLLHTHYKTQLNFTFAGLDALKESLQRLSDFTYRLNNHQDGKGGQLKPHQEKVEQEFAKGLADDLNISHSLAALFDFVREVNGLMDEGTLSPVEVGEILQLLKRFNAVLDILDFSDQELDIPDDVKRLFDLRLQARKEKNWSGADQLRQQILKTGYMIEDSPTGARLKKL